MRGDQSLTEGMESGMLFEILCQRDFRPTGPYLALNQGIFPRLERLQDWEDFPHVLEERWVTSLPAPPPSTAQAMPGAGSKLQALPEAQPVLLGPSEG